LKISVNFGRYNRNESKSKRGKTKEEEEESPGGIRFL